MTVGDEYILDVEGGINIDSNEAVANAIEILAPLGGVDITSTGAGLDIDLLATGGRVTITTTEAAGSQIHLEAQGTIADGTDAIILETTEGGIKILSDGDTEGDIDIDAEDDLTVTIAGNATFNITGTTSFSDKDLTQIGDISVADIIMDANAEIMVAYRTIIKTINADSDDGNTDFACDDTAANQSEQVINLGAIIPAYAEIVSIQVRCYESVTGGNAMAIDVGTSSGGAEIIATANIDTATDISATAAAAGPEVIATNGARSVYVNMTPDANWNTPLNEGKWAVMVTYLDYGAVYTQDSPP